MTGQHREHTVRLHRDALNTPWGLRLQGGRDFKTPLSVQRVFVGSPADSELHRGDVILAIENYDAAQVTHKQAQDLIKAAGSVLTLRIRSGTPASRPVPTVFQPALKPAPQSFGTDYSHRGGRPTSHPHTFEQPGMLGKVKQSLNHAIWQPGDQYGDQYGHEGEDPYQQRSVSDLTQQFAPHQHYQHHAGDQYGDQYGHEGEDAYQQRSVSDLTQQFTPHQRFQHHAGHSSKGSFYSTNRSWSRPDPGKTGSLPKSLTEPGWTPGQQSQWHPVRGPGTPNTGAFNPVNVPSPGHRPHPSAGYQPRHIESGNPAWAGTLRSSGGPKPWEVREAESIAPGSGGPMPRSAPEAVRAQSLPGPSPAQVQPHQPRVQNMHYGADGGQRYEQHDPNPGSHEDAKVVHMQYNSPLGLYSKQSVKEAMHGQLSNKPGEGTIGVTSTGPGKNFDPRRSEVLRMLAEEGQAAGQAAHHNAQQQGQYVSPSMQALEQRFGGEEAFGTSDF